MLSKMIKLNRIYVLMFCFLFGLAGCGGDSSSNDPTSTSISPWTKLLGVAGKETYGYGIAADTSGNSYVTGYTMGALDGQTLTGDSDVFVVKYDSSGVKQWTDLLGVANQTTIGNGIAVDTSGVTYVTGYTTGALDGQTLTGVTDVFVTTVLSD